MAEDRLSRNLDDRDFTEVINHQICRLESRNVLDDMVIAIDPGDIRKKYAAKMKGLCKIHDWSEHEIGERYLLVKAVAAAELELLAVVEGLQEMAGWFFWVRNAGGGIFIR